MSARILVVDDEAEMVAVLGESLRASGYEVFTARDGKEALETVRQTMPDLVILDLQMQGMDGLTACEILKNDPATARLPVLLMSGEGGQLARLQGLALGAHDFMPKPFLKADLLQRVEAALAARQL